MDYNTAKKLKAGDQLIYTTDWLTMAVEVESTNRDCINLKWQDCINLKWQDGEHSSVHARDMQNFARLKSFARLHMGLIATLATTLITVWNLGI